MATFAEQLNKLLEDAEHILITGPADPSLDVVSTASAWSFFLLAQNKKVDLVFAGRLPRLDFLKNQPEIQAHLEAFGKFKILVDLKKTKVKQLSYDIKDQILAIDLMPEGGFLNSSDVKAFSEDYRYDLILSLGASSFQDLGTVFSENVEFFHQKPIINIDRQVSNENFGQLNIVESTATSIAEVSYPFLQERLEPALATAVLAGMIAATNSFQSIQVTPQTLDLASSLIVAGADRGKIIEVLYRTKNIAVLQVWGKVLSRLKKNGAIIFSNLKHEEAKNLPEDFQDLVKGLILSNPQTQVAIIFYQLDFENSEVWLYTKNNINALELSKAWQGVGNRQFAKFQLAQNIDTASAEIMGHLEAQMKLINNQE